MSLWSRWTAWAIRVLGGAPSTDYVRVSMEPRLLPLVSEVVVGGQESSRAATRQALVAALMGDSVVQTCMVRTANAISDAPLKLYDRMGVEVKDQDHAVFELLATYPGGVKSLINQLALDILADGNCFAEARGMPTPTSPLLGVVVRHDPGNVLPRVDAEGISLEGYRVTTLARQYNVEPSRVAHGRLYTVRASPDHLLGVPPLYPLLPELEGDRSLAVHLGTRPHGVEDGVRLTSRAQDKGELLDQVALMRRARERHGVWISTEGATVDSLGAGVGAPRDELPLREDLRIRVITALCQAPVVYGYKATNDSAATRQVIDAAEARRDLGAIVATSLQTILDLVCTAAQRRKGFRLAFDWSAEIALEALDAEIKRATLATEAVKAGAEPRLAWETAGLVWPGDRVSPAAIDPSAERETV
jgi:hypothetical protein